jgi:hypothetical protein
VDGALEPAFDAAEDTGMTKAGAEVEIGRLDRWDEIH